MSRLTASRAAFDLIASFEGFRARAVPTPLGGWTLGFGHTATAREGVNVTRAQAEDLLRWDLLIIEDAVRQIALTPLSQSQFDALISFTFNIGLDNFKNSDVLKFLNQGQPLAAALSMHAWRRALVNGRVITIDALVRRRAVESAMFLETIGARPAAPTSMIRPQIDYGAALLAHAHDGEKTGASLSFEAEQIAEEAAKPALYQAADQGPVVRPPPAIPPLADMPAMSSKLDTDQTGDDRLAPCPQNLNEPAEPEAVTPPPVVVKEPTIDAPIGGSQVSEIEVSETIALETHNKPRAFSLWLWGFMILGAALMAFGIYFSLKSGILTSPIPNQTPKLVDLLAPLAAASGFIMFVTSAVSALNGDGEPV